VLSPLAATVARSTAPTLELGVPLLVLRSVLEVAWVEDLVLTVSANVTAVSRVLIALLEMLSKKEANTFQRMRML